MDVSKPIKINTGYSLSFLVILTPLILWLLGFDPSGLSGAETAFLAIEKASAFCGMAMFAWSLILSGRYKLFDTLFNGLDKMYIAHRFFGTASVALLLLHPLGYTFTYLYNEGLTNLTQHFLGYKSFGFVLGRISLYGLIILGIWSIFTKVKHETFIAVHRVLGVLFVLGAVHAFLAGPDSALQNNPALYWYMLILSLVATLTFLHYSLLSDFLRPYFKYRITSFKGYPGDVWEVRLKPRQRLLNFKPGQFVYLSFETLPEHGYHPFSIASGKHASELQLYIKELGDLTSNMDQLKPGDKVKLKGPYGGFTFDDRGYEKQLWIAAGIGITPFLSKARSLQYSKMTPKIELIYAVRAEHEAIAKDELLEIEKVTGSFNATIVDEKTFGRQSLHDIADHLGDIEERAIYLCGPPAMMKSYEEQAKNLGLEDQLFYEEFTI